MMETQTKRKIMKKLIIAILLFTSTLLAETTVTKTGCVLSQEGEVAVGWKAYKTAAKIGVGGVFDKVIYTSVAKEGKNFKEILVGSSVTIHTGSVNSKNEGRDKKLVAQFFKLFASETIQAKITGIEAKSKETGKAKTGTLMVDIEMNGVTKNIPMKYIFKEGTMHAEGYIDLFDFQGLKALSSINKACFDLHKGKTWNDVSIGFDMKIKADLCNIDIKK